VRLSVKCQTLDTVVLDRDIPIAYDDVISVRRLRRPTPSLASSPHFFVPALGGSINVAKKSR